MNSLPPREGDLKKRFLWTWAPRGRWRSGGFVGLLAGLLARRGHQGARPSLRAGEGSIHVPRPARFFFQIPRAFDPSQRHSLLTPVWTQLHPSETIKALSFVLRSLGPSLNTSCASGSSSFLRNKLEDPDSSVGVPSALAYETGRLVPIRLHYDKRKVLSSLLLT